MHRARTRTRASSSSSSRTKQRRGRDLHKVTFSVKHLNYKGKIINNLQEVDECYALF